MFQPGFANRLAKAFQFSFIAFGYQFNPAIRQIADGPRHLETVRDRFDRVAEADTLHAARIKNLHSSSIHGNDPTPMCHNWPAPGRKITSPPVLTLPIKP